MAGKENDRFKTSFKVTAKPGSQKEKEPRESRAPIQAVMGNRAFGQLLKAIESEEADAEGQLEQRGFEGVIQRVTQDQFVGSERVKFGLVRKMLMESRGGYSQEDANRILKEVPYSEMEIILGWSDQYIRGESCEQLAWNIKALDILRNPDAFEESPVPATLKQAEKFYCIDATHRGDMYHIRAACAVEVHPILIYKSAESSGSDLVGYLESSSNISGEKIVVIPVEFNPFEKTAPGAWKRFVSQYPDKIVSESGSTDIIARNSNKKKEISEAMGIVTKKTEEKLKEAVDEVFGEGGGSNNILVMHRGSGKTGAYPELDSGKALPQLLQHVKDAGKVPIICGAEVEDEKTIGRYWEKLPKPKKGESKRDIETRFMKIAYDKKKYASVIGFRSGALDMYTFLGIPTISISLKDIMGEARHQKFNKAWKRELLTYSKPRHPDTNTVKEERSKKKMYMSPWWEARGGGPGGEHTRSQEEAGAFSKGDNKAIGDAIRRNLNPIEERKKKKVAEQKQTESDAKSILAAFDVSTVLKDFEGQGRKKFIAITPDEIENGFQEALGKMMSFKFLKARGLLKKQGKIGFDKTGIYLLTEESEEE